MNQKETVGSAVPSLSDVDDREGQDRPLYATRVIGQEVWKAEVLLMATGVSIGYTQRGKRVDLGLAMGCVKEDISEIKGNRESHDLRICRLLNRV
jgi:hypothetical protein